MTLLDQTEEEKSKQFFWKLARWSLGALLILFGGSWIVEYGNLLYQYYTESAIWQARLLVSLEKHSPQVWFLVCFLGTMQAINGALLLSGRLSFWGGLIIAVLLILVGVLVLN